MATNSSLVDVTVLSPNHSGARTEKISRITPHCVVGQLDARTIGECFKQESVQASCNYGIGKDGDVALIVGEGNRSWCTSNKDNDQKAVTIECACEPKTPYEMNEKVYKKLIELCTDICVRNNFKKLIWIEDKNKNLSYKLSEDECIITVHRWFANKECCGDWLFARLGDVAKEVTHRLQGTTEKKKLYRVQVGSFENKDNAINLQNELYNKYNITSCIQEVEV